MLRIQILYIKENEEYITGKVKQSEVIFLSVLFLSSI